MESSEADVGTGHPGQKALSIISAMLKAEVAGIGFPKRVRRQGGIISPLLSNIVLNELDWWVASQWEEMPTKRNYVHRIYANGTPDKSNTNSGIENLYQTERMLSGSLCRRLQNLLQKALRRCKAV